MIIARTITGEGMPVDKNDLVMAVCLYAVIIKDGKILISPQWKENGYDFPGGHLDIGENHLDGLIREVKEETGFTVRPKEVIDITTSMFFHPRKKIAEHNVLIYYSAEIISGEISTDGFDEGEKSYAKEARFVTLNELKAMEFMAPQEPLKTILPYLERNVCN